MPLFPHSHGFAVYGGTFVEYSGNSANDPSGIDTLLQAVEPDAADDSSARDRAPRCHPGTRKQYLSDILHWGHPSPVGNFPLPLLWMKGPAGVGKSAIAQTSIETLKSMSIPCCSFFFSINGRSNPDRLFPTIAYQLAVLLPEYRDLVDQLLRRDKTIVRKSMKAQFHKLLVDPLQQLSAKGAVLPGRIPIFIDGLDECDGADAQAKIVGIISATAGTTPLCWAFFSRPESHIDAAFSSPAVSRLCHKVMLPVSRDIDGEIELYLRSGFNNILRRRNLAELWHEWPSKEDINTLVDAADGFFIYCSTVLRFVELSSWFGPEEPLRRIIDVILNPADGLQQGRKSPFAELDALYLLAMERIPNELRRHIRLLLGLVYLLRTNPTWSWDNYVPFSVVLLSNILGWSTVEFRSVCNHLSAVFYFEDDQEHFRFPDDVDTTRSYTHLNPSQLLSLERFVSCDIGGSILFFHKSFYDFLSSPERSGPHSAISQESLRDMFEFLIDRHTMYDACFSDTEHGVPAALFPLPWPGPNELVDSMIRAETYVSTHDLLLQLSNLPELNSETDLKREMRNCDFRKALLVQTTLWNPQEGAIPWFNEIASSTGYALFDDGTRMFWASDESFAEFDFLKLKQNLNQYQQAGVLQKLDHYPGLALSPRAPCESGLCILGHGPKSIFWYWEYSPRERYYQEFQTVDIQTGIKKVPELVPHQKMR